MTQLSLDLDVPAVKDWYVEMELFFKKETKYLIKSRTGSFTEYWTNDLTIPEKKK